MAALPRAMERPRSLAWILCRARGRWRQPFERPLRQEPSRSVAGGERVVAGGRVAESTPTVHRLRRARGWALPSAARLGRGTRDLRSRRPCATSCRRTRRARRPSVVPRPASGRAARRAVRPRARRHAAAPVRVRAALPPVHIRSAAPPARARQRSVRRGAADGGHGAAAVQAPDGPRGWMSCCDGWFARRTLP